MRIGYTPHPVLHNVIAAIHTTQATGASLMNIHTVTVPPAGCSRPQGYTAVRWPLEFGAILCSATEAKCTTYYKLVSFISLFDI